MKTGLARFVLLICLVLQASVSFAADRITFIHTDASGTPIAGSDENGKLAWKAEYYPFGDQFETTSKFRESSLGFTGKPYEKDIGLNYFGARYYDPVIGRFISMDPAPIEAENHYSVNRYAYANNNPYKYIDPDGRLPIIPIFIFLAKEIAAEKLSQATGGASDFLSVRRAASKVARVFSKKVVSKEVNPKTLIGRQSKNEMSGSQVKRLRRDMRENGFDPSKPIEAADVDGRLIILDGHHRTKAAIAAGIKKVPINVNKVTNEQSDRLLKEVAESRL